jgi:hypothetical protein
MWHTQGNHTSPKTVLSSLVLPDGTNVHAASVAAGVQGLLRNAELTLEVPHHRTQFRRALVHGFHLLECEEPNWSCPDPVDQSDGHALIAAAARIRPSIDREVYVFRPLAAFAQRFLNSGREDLRDLAQLLLRR